MSIFDKYKYFALCFTFDAAGVDYLYLDNSLRYRYKAFLLTPVAAVISATVHALREHPGKYSFRSRYTWLCGIPII